jgi:hypothetical protein
MTFYQSALGINLARACGANEQQACTASQSTTVAGLVASIATDGSYDNATYSHTDGAAGSGPIPICGSGLDSMTPWWMVDLGSTRTIGGGKIWIRSDCPLDCVSRIDGFQVWVGSSSSVYNAAGNTKCYTATTTGHYQTYTHSFGCDAFGRYLYVILTSGKCLMMREVEVYRFGEQSFVSFFAVSEF